MDAFFRADKSFRDVIELFAVLAAQPLGGAFSAHGRLIGLAHGIHIVGDTKRSKRGLSDTKMMQAVEAHILRVCGM